MPHTNRPLLTLALAALVGVAPAATPGVAAAQGKGQQNGHAKQKSKGNKKFQRYQRDGRDGNTLGDRGLRRDGARDDDRGDDQDEARPQGRRARGTASGRIPPGHMPPAGMCRIWIDGVPPGRQPAPTDCRTAERNRPYNARVIYGGESAGSVSRGPLGVRTVVRRDASCADVNGDGRRERVSYVLDGRVVRTECR
jgi:hypothetical protein